MKPLIALLTDGIPPYVTGGMQRHSLELCRQLLKNGFHVHLVHCVQSGEHLPDAVEVKGIIIQNELFSGILTITGYHFPAPGFLPGHYLRNSLKYSKSIYDSLSGQKFDLIYSQGFTGWYFLHHKKDFTPIWVNFHGLNMFQRTIGLRSKLEAMMLRGTVKENLKMADGVISLGGHLTEILNRKIGIDASKIKVHPNGISSQWIKSEVASILESSKRRFLFVGRNDKIKQFDLIFGLAIEFKDRAQFGFVGPFAPLVSQETGITFYGEIKKEEQLKAIYDQHDIIVCTSISEGLPTTLLEGMARGLAVLTTPVGAASELISGNGIIVDGFDALAIKKGIQNILAMSETEFSNAKKRSLERVQCFTWDAIGEKVASDIKQLSSTEN